MTNQQIHFSNNSIAQIDRQIDIYFLLRLGFLFRTDSPPWTAPLVGIRVSTLPAYYAEMDRKLETACFFSVPFLLYLEATHRRDSEKRFPDDWDGLVRLLTTSTMGKQQLFCLRYAFQAVLYAVWRERSNHRHGEQALPLQILIKLTDKAIRNKLAIMQSKGVKGFEVFCSIGLPRDCN